MYGLGVRGLDAVAAELLRSGDVRWPEVAVSRDDAPAPETGTFTDRWATWVLRGGGSVHLEREAGEAVFSFPAAMAVDDLAIVHPHFFAVAATFSWWHGRDAFHGGAFAVDGGAVGVLADKGCGKSSTLAALHAAGAALVADDLVVLDGADVLPGPACVDLRPDAAAALGVGQDLGVVGGRQRWRWPTPAVVAPGPLLAWVVPAWGDGPVRLERIGARDLMAALVAAVALPVPVRDPLRLLDLARLPGYRLVRPRDVTRIGDAVELLRSLPAGG